LQFAGAGSLNCRAAGFWGFPTARGSRPCIRNARAERRRHPHRVLTGLEDEAIGSAGAARRSRGLSGQRRGSRHTACGQEPFAMPAERNSAEAAAKRARWNWRTCLGWPRWGRWRSGFGARTQTKPLTAILNYASVCLEQIESQKRSSPVALHAIQEVMNETRPAGAITAACVRSSVNKQPHSGSPGYQPACAGSGELMGFEAAPSTGDFRNSN